MKIVFIAENPGQAHVVRIFLQGNGIDATVQGEDLYYVRGEVPMTGSALPSVWVLKDEDIGPAQELVEKFLKSGLESKEDADEKKAALWKCEKCGEMIEAQFNECWKCAGENPQEEEA